MKGPMRAEVYVMECQPGWGEHHESGLDNLEDITAENIHNALKDRKYFVALPGIPEIEKWLKEAKQAVENNVEPNPLFIGSEPECDKCGYDPDTSYEIQYSLEETERTESFNLKLAEYYDGNLITDGNKSIPLNIESGTAPEAIVEEVFKQLPAHFEDFLDKTDIRNWIILNRSQNTREVETSCVIGMTNTHDVQGTTTRWVTYQLSGTEYSLEHTIKEE